MQKPSFLSHFSAVTSSFFFDFFARNLLLVKLSHFQPDITAPDVDIIASYSEGNGPMELPADQRRIPFNVLSSTSMSCPHVSGVISLLKALYLEWTPAVIKSANMTTEGQHSLPQTRASSSREAPQTTVPQPLAHHSANPEAHRLFLDCVRHRTIVPERGFTTHIELCELEGADLKRAHDIIDNFTNRGLRSPGVARQTVEEKTKESVGEPWEFVGLLPLFDPPRENIVESFKDEYETSSSFSGIVERAAPCSV
ncbi:hypothetical protein OROMI_009461 [Orobanche minor]